MFGFCPPSDDELATACHDSAYKATLGVGAEETLMLVIHIPGEDGEPADVAAEIADGLNKPTAVLGYGDGRETVLAFARPRLRTA